MARRWHVVVVLAYLALALWALRAILPGIADSYPLPVDVTPSAVDDGDESHVVWAATRTARTLATAPWRLWDFEFCHPFPEAVALGHHGYASALVAALPYAVTGEPVLAHNVVALRHPDPIVPAWLIVRWYDSAAAPVAEQRVRMLLPLALAARDTASRRAALVVPPDAGTYRVTLAPADAPATVLSTALVTVEPASPTPARTSHAAPAPSAAAPRERVLPNATRVASLPRPETQSRVGY